MRQLGTTGIKVFPLCLGGNVFGWTADEDASFAVMDAYANAGGNFIDTADVYGNWLGKPGISETIIGEWMKSRGIREQMVIATKVGSLPNRSGASAANIRAAVDESLQRLQTEYVDVYFMHRDFADVPLEETLTALDELVKSGKVRVTGASNYSRERLEESLKISEQQRLTHFDVLQNEYNLMNRAEYEDDMTDLLVSTGIASVPYYSLASGFLTGKYRPGSDVDSVRSGNASKYANERGWAVLDALDALATKHTTTVAAVALTWLAEQASVTAPIASARTASQPTDILPMAQLQLSNSELQLLADASAS